DYLTSLRGRKLLTFEETTGSHWLYVELRESVDRILVCDPYRNALLRQGPKTDKIDAAKLCHLLRAGLLHEVHHTLESDYWLRKLVRCYWSLVKSGVRVQNQKSALYRAVGLHYKKEPFVSDNWVLNFVADYLDETIVHYESYKKCFQQQFHRLRHSHPVIGYLAGISGIGKVNAVTLYALVLDARRFATKYHFWSYCGLVRHEKISGGRSYGNRRGRYASLLKFVFRTAAMTAIGGHNDIREYYETLLAQGYSPQKAQHHISRYIATSCYAVMKHKVAYQPYQWRKHRQKQDQEHNSSPGLVVPPEPNACGFHAPDNGARGSIGMMLHTESQRVG
ncbi:IS110 family transposase, partial [Candidatus Parcubacteria bacterium]